MTDEQTPNLALLPAGLRDLLPPDAETEASAVEAVMEVFAGHGYQRVGDQWLIALEHVSVPADIATGKADLNSKL